MTLITQTLISDGTTIDASDVNTPISTIYNDYNGNITNANIAANAAIAGSKLGTGTAGVGNANLNQTAGNIGGVYAAWVPEFTGWSSNPANGLYYYSRHGQTVILTINQPTNGTSNATTCTLTLPFPAVTRTNARWTAPAEAVDNNTALTTPAIAVILSAGTTVTFAKDYGYNAFTNSGNKRIASCTITYEAA